MAHLVAIRDQTGPLRSSGARPAGEEQDIRVAGVETEAQGPGAATQSAATRGPRSAEQPGGGAVNPSYEAGWKRAAAESGLIISLPQRAQVAGEAGGGGEGVGVVFAQDPAAPVQGVLVQVAGDHAQVGGEFGPLPGLVFTGDLFGRVNALPS